jgi:serine protease DegQ
VERTAPATVLVEAMRGGARSGTGSGWVLDAAQGLVVTNAHVLNQGDAARIAAGGRRRDARVLGASPCEDVALLQVADTAGLRSAPLRDGAVRQGETVVALGYPRGADPRDALTSTTGVVSVAHTAYRDGAPDVPALTDALQTDTALNPGNSGGPLVDLDGRLVGMNAAVRSAGDDGRALQNQNYAISAARVRAVVSSLRAREAVPGWTGLTFAYPTAAQLAERRLPPGLLVTGAVAGSPADRAGLGATSEVLAGLDGRPVGTTLRAFCAAAAMGDAAPRRLAFGQAGSARLREVALRR